MSTYDRLADGVKSWIDAKGWTDFSEIQAVAIPKILDGSGALLIAPTASGKTEAAILPIVSNIIQQRALPVALLYVAPLRALINDQALRIQRVIEETSLRAAWWHGDLASGKRKDILRHPPHAILTTPESIEVMLSSDGYGHGALLGNIRYVLIDEVHSFADDDRGAQLMSLLARLEARMKRPFTRIALSATISAPELVATWMASSRDDSPLVEVIREGGTRGRKIGVGLIPEIRDGSLSKREAETKERQRIADVIAQHVRGRRSIVFAGSRADAEDVTADLSDRGIETHIHHASIDVEIRRKTEEVFRTEGPKTIVATSTLELGIDIGDLEQVIQIGAPLTVSSWLQRIGRSGRRGDVHSVGIIYARSMDELPVALAVSDLALRNAPEPIVPDTAALSILFHQVINLVRERDKISRDEAFLLLAVAGCFRGITYEEFQTMVNEQIEMGFLEEERGQLELGPETERKLGFANFRDFYSVFETEVSWTVKCGGEKIGTLQEGFPVAENRENCFILAGRRWRVTAIDRERMILLVEPAKSGTIPKWTSAGGDASFEVMQRTLDLLTGDTTALETSQLRPYMDKERAWAASLGLAQKTIVVAYRENDTIAYTYLGDQVNRYLMMLVRAALKCVVSSSPDALAVSEKSGKTPKELADLLRRIVSDESYRTELEREAFSGVIEVPIGKYWRCFGPQTRRNVLQRFHTRGASVSNRLLGLSVIVTRQIESTVASLTADTYTG